MPPSPMDAGAALPICRSGQQQDADAHTHRILTLPPTQTNTGRALSFPLPVQNPSLTQT